MPDPSPASPATPTLVARLRAWLAALRPAPMRVDAAERLRVVAGATLGLLFTAVLTHRLFPHAVAVPWLVAPLGASAVLVFGVPASPLAQPWAVVGGNTLSALVGIACVHLLGDVPELAAAVAVGGAIGLMFLLRCLHPPGGAAALLMVLANVRDPRFALDPVLANSVLMVVAGMVYNSVTGRRYPHPQVSAPAPAPAAATNTPAFTEADLEAALARYNQVLDVPEDDLRALVHEAALQGTRRRLSTLRCADIMSTDVAVAQWGTPLAEAWALLAERGVKALPVIDRARRVVGIVTVADFLRAAALDAPRADGRWTGEWPARLRRLLRPAPVTHSDKPEVVGQIMSRQVRVASDDRPLAELVPMFAGGGHHHLPVIGDEGRLVGILTQSDLVAALAHMDGVGGLSAR